jgi:hypothetical protein
LLSLPLALETEVATIPAARYLRAPPAAIARWREKLGEHARPVVGLVWRGDPDNPDDRKRSLPLTELLASLPASFRYISLQKELYESERVVVAAHCIDLRACQELDFVETAALCGCVDLVISVDTSIAHLSAAMGRKTWIMLPFNADCRWLLDRDDSPWYPSATLYRQAQSGDWRGVLTRVAADLSRQFGQFSPAQLAAPPCTGTSTLE